MNLTRLIPSVRYGYRSYLQMLVRLFPRGAAWKFPSPPHSPIWVELDTYQESAFEDYLIGDEWASSFRTVTGLQIWNDQFVAVRIDNPGEYRALTGYLSGDMQFEWSIMLRTTSNYDRIRVHTSSGVVCSLGWRYNYLGVWNSSGELVESKANIHAQYQVLSFRIIRSGGIFSFQYKFDEVWNTFQTTYSSSGNVYLESVATGDAGFLSIKGQATTGFALKNYPPESELGKLLACFADELHRFEKDIMKLIREAVPGLSKELLSSWEAIAGLPDESIPSDLTIEQRRQITHTRITQAKGEWTSELEYLPLTPVYYIKYAESLGMTITITTDPGGIVFRFSTKRPGELQRFSRTPNEGIDGARLNKLGATHTWLVNVVSDPQNNREILEAAFEELKPFYTQVTFNP